MNIFSLVVLTMGLFAGSDESAVDEALCARELRADHLGELLQSPDAVEQLEQIVALNQRDSDALAFLASAYATDERFAEAARTLKTDSPKEI